MNVVFLLLRFMTGLPSIHHKHSLIWYVSVCILRYKSKAFIILTTGSNFLDFSFQFLLFVQQVKQVPLKKLEGQPSKCMLWLLRRSNLMPVSFCLLLIVTQSPLSPSPQSLCAGLGKLYQDTYCLVIQYSLLQNLTL